MEGGRGSEEDSSAALCNALDVISRWASRDRWFITHISSSSPEEEEEPSSLCEALLNDVVIATSSSSPESDVSPSFLLLINDRAVALACAELLGDKRATLEDSDPVE